MLDIDFFQLTDVGCVRTENEDAIGHWPHDDGVLFAVADGVGGNAGGEVASALALEMLGDRMENASGSWSIAKRLRWAVRETNLGIYNKAITVPELRGMATTLTAAAIVGGELTAAHVGDCRLFLFRDGTLTQLTKDHTWVGEQVQYGLLSPEQARTHPKRHVVTRCLGRELIVGIDVLTLPLQREDVLLQCSDGVYGAMDEEEITAVLCNGVPEPACRAFVEKARQAGGEDNASVQIAVVRECPAPRQRPWWRLGR